MLGYDLLLYKKNLTQSRVQCLNFCHQLIFSLPTRLSFELFLNLTQKT